MIFRVELKLRVIGFKYEDSSTKNKAHSNLAGIFRRPLTKAGNCSIVMSLITGYKDKKHSLIGQVSKG